jgi:hypothetical protein
MLDDSRGRDDFIHDPCVHLIEIGDATSVPHLIGALKYFPDREEKEIVCTWDHCVEALEKITGDHPGVSYSAWRRWQSRQPR